MTLWLLDGNTRMEDWERYPTRSAFDPRSFWHLVLCCDVVGRLSRNSADYQEQHGGAFEDSRQSLGAAQSTRAMYVIIIYLMIHEHTCDERTDYKLQVNHGRYDAFRGGG